MKPFNIKPVNDDLKHELQRKIDFKTKPIGALGQLERIALKIGQIQNSTSPVLTKPHLVVFAADHGLAKEGVSAYPQEVTHQMVLNFAEEGAAINVFCNQYNIELLIVDAGVNYNFHNIPHIIDSKIGYGTASSLHDQAMEIEKAQLCIEKGAEVIRSKINPKCNVIGFGEMGIGNSSAAAIIMHYITGKPIKKCIGKGTGVNDKQLQRKMDILTAVVEKHGKLENPLEILAAVGGFEIGQMIGAYLQSAADHKLILVDGFIATAAYALAQMINPLVSDYVLFSHQSEEKGHAAFLSFLEAEPILNLELRLGEGTGSALVYPLIEAAVNFVNKMSSFEAAGVSNKT